jgi:hypothetical protein
LNKFIRVQFIYPKNQQRENYFSKFPPPRFDKWICIGATATI